MLTTAQRLGWKSATISLNTRGCWDGSSEDCQRNCNLCQFGCDKGCKQSTLSTFLGDALKTGRCQVATEMEAIRIVFDSRTRRASGVLCKHLPSGREVVINAPRVVSSGGAIGTPALLLRSRIRDPHIGAHLRLHPVTFVNLRMASPTNRWFGPLLTAVVSEHDNYDGSHYGPKLETHPLGPDLCCMVTPPSTPTEFKENLFASPNEVSWFSILRDYDSKARLYVDKHGVPHVTFALGKKDAEGSLYGVRQMIILGEQTGCVSLRTGVRGLGPLVFGRERKADLDAYLAKLDELGPEAMRNSNYGCAHQMSSCRMASTPELGAVRPTGELYAAPGVWVSDASLFPTASGVNPYFSVAALAYHVARQILQDISRYE